MSFLLSCLPCFNPAPVLKINTVKFKILKLLGEGGFSYVYLVQASNGGTYALKKIRCLFGAESVKIAMTEVENYKEFHSPYIIRAIDSSIVQEQDGSKTVYILLPNFDRGSLQDMITHNVINGTIIEESEAIRIFIGACRGLQSMHRHNTNHRRNNNNRYNINSNGNFDDDDDNDNDSLGLEVGQEDENLLPVTSDTDQSEIDTLPELINPDNNGIDDATELSEFVAYAHRDIKPANIMLSKDGLPVLCDLGSCAKARIQVKTRSSAVAIQELAAEHCTLPYRAPELLDVKTGSKIDEKIDIWSLGCTLFALLYGCSPFEREESTTGASMNLAISSGRFSFPNDDIYSDEIKELIQFCLVVNPEQRPSIEKVLSKALALQR